MVQGRLESKGRLSQRELVLLTLADGAETHLLSDPEFLVFQQVGVTDLLHSAASEDQQGQSSRARFLSGAFSAFQTARDEAA